MTVIWRRREESWKGGGCVTICLEVVDFGLIFLRGGAGLARELTKLARKMYGFAPDN